MDVYAHLILVFCCLVLSAFFSGSETALLRLSTTEVDREARAPRGPTSVAIRDLLRSTSRLLVTILLGNNLVNILAASVASALAVAYLGEELGIALATALLTIVVLVFCEVLPKAVAARNPRRFAGVVALPLYLVHQAMRPIHAAYDRMLDPLVHRISGSGAGEPGTAPADVLQLATRVGLGQPAGSPLAIMSAAARAARTTVEEIMVPVSEVVSYPIASDPAELLEQALQERYTRFPLHEESVDRIAGILHLKDLIKFVRAGGSDLRQIAKPVHRVPEGKPILPLLAEMQGKLVQMAIVKDEFGRTEGVVTQEDILEEIVGEIRDEFDADELLMIRPLPDGGFSARGAVRVADFNRDTGYEIPAARGDTLGGLVFDRLGRQPARQDTVRVSGYEIRVIGVSGTRITQVQVRKPGSPPDAAAGASQARV